MRRALIFCALAGGVAWATPAKKKPQKKQARHAKIVEKTDPSRLAMPKDATESPAYRYGQLSPSECYAELDRRKIAYAREDSMPGVLAPVRLAGPLHGVTFHTDLPEKQRATTPWEIGDCRLVLAVDDFAAILAAHDVVDVRHYSMYRPPEKGWPADKIGTRHNGALALDAARFTNKAGDVLDVDKDFHGKIDAKTCGEGAAPDPATPEALELRKILCEAVDARLFNVVLTPNYNKPHHNHFHLEVTAGVKWFLVH